jgi:hypothetical protein
VEQSYQTLIIIWASLLMSQLVFVGIVFVVKPELLSLDLRAPVLGPNGVIVVVLAVISLVDFILSIVLRRKHLEMSVAEQNVALVQTAMIIGCALAEAISLFGLLLAFAFDYPYFYLFSAFGVLAVIFHFPRRSDVHAASYKELKAEN